MYIVTLIWTNSHSFGYDCQRHFNLVLLEEEILAFASGNLIHIFNVVTKELQFRRSAGGGGIGHMTVRTFFQNLLFIFG
jgi:hypothetical protein